MSNNRWRTAIHEAGHGAAAIAFGGRCDRLELFPSGGGEAWLHDLPANQQAYATAAGPRAEHLANEHAPPAVENVNHGTQITNERQAREVAKAPITNDESGAIWAAFKKRMQPSDDVAIARWAITDHEDNPDCWARRVSFANCMADQIVADNIELIVALATELYILGKLDAADIKNITEQSNQQQTLEAVA